MDLDRAGGGDEVLIEDLLVRGGLERRETNGNIANLPRPHVPS
jgi:hypothetical protein